jgi:hypothetical protein
MNGSSNIYCKSTYLVANKNVNRCPLSILKN